MYGYFFVLLCDFSSQFYSLFLSMSSKLEILCGNAYSKDGGERVRKLVTNMYSL